MTDSTEREPFAARLHFIPVALNRPQAAMVRLLRRYFERAPGWVLLTTRGRKTGLPREVLLPCERWEGALLVISTYGRRAHWIQNIHANPAVHVTCAGWTLPAHAAIVADLDAKRALVGEHPFVPPAPFGVVHLVFRTLLRPLLVWRLRRWVKLRPVVVICLDQPSA